MTRRIFDIGRPAVSEHLQVLRAAKLVREEARGRERLYHLDPRPLEDVTSWVEAFTRYWDHRLDDLDALLAKEKEKNKGARPVSAVWHALTAPELMARWWAKGDVRAVVGHRFTMDMGKWGQQPCEVTAVIPERRLVYRFATDTMNTTITWELTPEGSGTKLRLVHDGSMSIRRWAARRSKAWARVGRVSSRRSTPFCVKRRSYSFR